MGTAAPTERPSQLSPRVAVVEASAELTAAIRSTFVQLAVQFEPVPLEQLPKRKFEGFVVDLRAGNAEEILEAIRSSPRNRRAVLFGVYADQSDTRRFSKYGVNAFLAWPLKRADAVKVLRSTQTLLLHELRRYARIPLATEVELVVSQETFHGTSREVSAGGMSMQLKRLPSKAKTESAEAKFKVPPGKAVTLQSVVCWVNEPDAVLGIKFMPEPEALQHLRAWIDAYLGTG